MVTQLNIFRFLRCTFVTIAALLTLSCTTHRCPDIEAPKVVTPEQPQAEPEPVEVEPMLVLQKVDYSELPGWQNDKVGQALPALLKSCKRLMKKKDDALVARDEHAGQVKDWKAACAAAASVKEGQGHAYFEEHFHAYLAMNHDEPEGRFTGYYEASLRGSRKRKGPYQTPLYKKPKDLVMVNMREFTHKPGRRRIAGRVVRGQLKPYETRGEIRKGSLKGKGLELVWIDDPIDGFFTQIQGSGLVELDNGKQMRIGYAGQNGHVYTAIGRELIVDGHITREEMSMQAIRSWLEENPEAADEMMDRNQAYVFFTELNGEGPVGSQNVELTPERSAAIDRRYIAQSAPLFIDTEIANEDGTDTMTFQKLVIAQDSGGAIRGPVRADIFWGAGKRAANIAGRLKSRGRYFVLLPKTVNPNTQTE
jgi:membrane-bound lytic murein transglycosylase A